MFPRKNASPLNVRSGSFEFLADAINGKLEGEFLGIPHYTHTLLFVWFPLFLGMPPPPPPPPPLPPQISQPLTH